MLPSPVPPCCDPRELAGGFQRLLDRAQHRAEEWTMQLGDEHAHGIGAACRQRLRDGIGLVAKLAHGVQHLLTGLLADLRARVDDPGHGGEGDTCEFRDFVDVCHQFLLGRTVLLYIGLVRWQLGHGLVDAHLDVVEET
jgi:hypothetical protein